MLDTKVLTVIYMLINGATCSLDNLEPSGISKYFFLVRVILSF